MSETARGHVFISYIREDAAAVDRLQGVLETAGIRVWRDTTSLWPGEDWRTAIRRAISDDALVFLACFSRASQAHQASYQNEELLLAIEQMRRRHPGGAWLIPVRFDDSEIPDLPIGGGRTLASIQRCDFFGSERQSAATRLIGAIQRALAPSAPSSGTAAVSAGGSGPPDVDFLLGTADSDAEGLQALVVSAESDAGFAQDLGRSLLGLGVELPLVRWPDTFTGSADIPR